jgi:NADPH-dependent glutamate synthase beta subunit-like oxidoreductase/Pyruvate/2-oxoacid:ferredoxin oxidoreductase delta subunit
MISDLGPARPVGWSEPGRTTLEIKTGAWRTRRPMYVEAGAPCRAACPAGEPIARWIERARLGDYAGAWALIRQENPFPAIMGRVCAHPCEVACNRGHWDGAVAINALERFVGDWGLDHGASADFEITRPERVAVVGGGPAGLACAYHLSRLGYRVLLLEAQAALGGVLRYGIPEYRLPRAVLDREIDLAIGSSVKILTRRQLGENLSWNSLRSYDAVFVAIGAAVPLPLRVPGEEMRGIGDGLSFLRLVNSGAPPPLGERLVVVGGGSTAMDVARSARRLGVGSVTVLALEAREEMPALPDEVTQALAEGVEIMNGFGVSEFVGTAEGVSGVVARPAQLSRDETGAVHPRFETGQSVALEASAVLLAIGQRTDLSALPAAVPRDRGLIVVDADGATPSGNVFAGGDAASTARTVTHAIAAGARAARGIHARLSGRQAPRDRGVRRFTTDMPAHVVDFKEINRAHFKPARRAGRLERPAGQRVRSFVETEGTLGETAARAEMARCFTCGHCTLCDTCFIVCPDMAIHHRDGGYRIAAEHCKGCGLCVEECPRGALHMVSER